MLCTTSTAEGVLVVVTIMMLVTDIVDTDAMALAALAVDVVVVGIAAPDR